MTRRHKTATLVAAAVFALAGCGGSDDTDPSADSGADDTEDTGSDDTGSDGTSETGDTGGDSESSDGEAVLRYGAANQVTRFDAHKSSNGYDQNWLAPVYERLIWQTPEAEQVPGLATEWEFVDDTTFTMELREGVTFHDGEPFNAEAVVANIDRAINVDGSGLHAYLASVESVEATGEYSVQFNLNRPDATMPNHLSTRPGMMISPAAFDNPDLDVMPVGTGPFKLVEYREGDRAIFERNPDYWDPEYTTLDRLEILYIPEGTTRLNALRSGQVDAAVLDVGAIDEAESDPSLNVQVADTIEVFHYQMDRTKNVFGDPLVRKALSHAIDREAIVEGLMLGYAQPATQWVIPGTEYYLDELGESTTYDPELAKELLAEAGYPDGFSAEAYVSVQPTYIQLAEILVDQFSQIGVELSVQQDPNLADAFFVREATESIVSPYPGRIDPSETAQIYFNDESFSNPGRHVSDSVKQAWEESLIPGEGRHEAVLELQRALDESMLNVPILHPQVGLGSVEGVEGLEWYLSGHIEFKGVTVS